MKISKISPTTEKYPLNFEAGGTPACKHSDSYHVVKYIVSLFLDVLLDRAKSLSRARFIMSEA